MVDRSKVFHENRLSRTLVTAEDYTELISELIETKGEARVRDIALTMGVSHVTVLRTIQRLRLEGYVKEIPLVPIELTRKGKELALRSKERHDCLLRFLKSLGVPDEIAKVDVEGIEHYISQETLYAIQKFLQSKKS